MSTQKQVAVLVGSLRTGSFTRMVANALADFAPAELTLEIKEIGNLGLFRTSPKKPAETLRLRSARRRMSLIH